MAEMESFQVVVKKRISYPHRRRNAPIQLTLKSLNASWPAPSATSAWTGTLISAAATWSWLLANPAA